MCSAASRSFFAATQGAHLPNILLICSRDGSWQFAEAVPRPAAALRAAPSRGTGHRSPLQTPTLGPLAQAAPVVKE